MATSFNFNGNTIKIPGVYSNIKSGIKNPTLNLPYGNVVVIDTGSGAGFGGGAGIQGQLESGKKAVYEFDNIQDFREFTKGGLWWLLASPLFRPAGLNFSGISKLTYIRAAATTAAEIGLTFTGASDSSAGTEGGSITLQVTDEGLGANGVLNATDELIKGFATKMTTGLIDSSKFMMKFYVGSYTGLDENGLPYDNISEADSKPRLLISSPEFNNIETLITWMKTDSEFQKNFKVKASTVTGDGSIGSDDLDAYVDYELATGGTEDYAVSGIIEDALEAIKDDQSSYILADQWGADAQSALNFRLAEFINNESVFKPELVVAGGKDRNEFALSLATAQFYDNDRVTVVHGGPRQITRQGLKLYSAMYTAAAVLGREAGIAPQVPLTFKNINVDSLQHDLTDKEVTQALDAGVVVVRLDGASFDVIKGVNTLQKNTFLVNEDGTTHSKQIRRIARQLNKEIIINAKQQLCKNPVGTNRNTLSPEDVKAWLTGYLRTKKALPGSDNLILDFYDITVSRNQDAYSVQYKFVPNSEINFIFFTGLIVEV